ncbi:protein-tyrosine phosphatase family protein [Desulforhopalus sp. 52FAK]
MSGYQLTWITNNLAVGHAPMSYAELDDIRDHGIDAIVNLCEEFCDLHELEENSGFEVFYLPITDEKAPKMEEMEEALAWIDEAMYLGKKVLVHCKHGVGRTGTFVTAYLLRRGLGLRKAEKLLKKTRANPTNFSQWWLLRKFGKKEGTLKIGQPTAANRDGLDLSCFYTRYEQLLKRVDFIVQSKLPETVTTDPERCCKNNFSLAPIEALYLNSKVNVGLSAKERQLVIDKASGGSGSGALIENAHTSKEVCPLYGEEGCMLPQNRPLQCRLQGVEFTEEQLAEISLELSALSQEIFRALFGEDNKTTPPSVGRSDAISGKFIQNYFQFLASQKKNR